MLSCLPEDVHLLIMSMVRSQELSCRLKMIDDDDIMLIRKGFDLVVRQRALLRVLKKLSFNLWPQAQYKRPKDIMYGYYEYFEYHMDLNVSDATLGNCFKKLDLSEYVE